MRTFFERVLKPFRWAGRQALGLLAAPFRLLKRIPTSWRLPLVIALLVGYPLVPGLEQALFEATNQSFGSRMSELFIFAILALALNVVVGYAGQLHIGIGAFFGIGAYVTGIVTTVPLYPFGFSFLPALVLAAVGATIVGVLVSAPTLRLRGDYLALVTLGFGEVMKFTLENLESITGGTKGINPVPPPRMPWQEARDVDWNWSGDFRYFYFLGLGFLALVILALRNIERSKLGRAWVALREDELAATCMGLNAARLKLAAFALGAGLAGFAGCLWAVRLGGTSDPASYGFNLSIIMLCCLILGGLGNRNGVLLGVLLILGFDKVVSPICDGFIQNWVRSASDPSGRVTAFGVPLGNTGSPYLSFSGWRLIVFGLVLVLVVRFRPEGLLPSDRTREEFHTETGGAISKEAT
jgi:branched-chain amino acid transport system permease protein